MNNYQDIFWFSHGKLGNIFPQMATKYQKYYRIIVLNLHIHIKFTALNSKVLMKSISFLNMCS